MTKDFTVPRLDLAPKLSRPLSSSNPLDYLRLLYWVFFFPQALQWYVNTFGSEHIPEEKMNWQNGWVLLLQNTIQRDLLIQGLVSILFLPVPLIGIFQILNFPVNWLNVGFCVLLGVLGGVVVSVAGNLARGVLGGVVLGAAIAVVVTLVGDAAVGVAAGVAVGVTAGLSVGMAAGVAGYMVAGVAAGMTVSVVVSVAGDATVGVTVGVAVSVAVLRPETWLLGSILNLLTIQDGSWLLPRITPLPLPNLVWRLQNWLQNDWETGLHNTNQLLAYTLQFISVIRAVNRVLAITPSEQIIWRISQLAVNPFDWQLLYSVSRYSRLNDFVRCTAAGFWYLHKQKPVKAVKAFTVVRSLLYGEEIYTLAQTLATFQKAKKLAAIATLQVPNFPQEPLLRPNTWKVLISLRQVVEDIDLVEYSLSSAVRSLAFNRALGELTNTLNKVDTLPKAEQGLIIDIAQTWKESLLQIAGEVGEISITKPVVNPYAVGDPVQGHLFVGREDIIRQLEELWVMGNQLQSVVLYGHRRMGKTSILVNAAQCLGSQIHLAYVNLLRLGDSPQGVGEVLMAICDEISQTVKLPPPTDADLLNLPYRTFERYLKQVEASLDGGLIIALDEFEKIEDLIEAKKIPIDFMGFLRGLVQMSSKIAFAFAGLHTLEEMTADYFQPFFASVIPIHVGFQQRAATRQILANPGNEDFPLDYIREALDEIYTLTHGQPYLVQLLGFQLVRRYNDFVFEQGRSRDPVFTIEDVEAVINNPQFFQRGRYYFDGIWGQAVRGAEGQQAIVQVLAPHPEGLSLDALAQSTGMNDTNLQQALNTLKRHDVVEEIQGSWRIMVELFRRWVLQQ
ncbi:MAG: ATP-binding protein [Nostoc sp. S4]|nr:ATP-binding protein [Nostoc sp. S4]